MNVRDFLANRPIVSESAYAGTEEKLRKVLEHYARTGRVNDSFKAAGIPPSTHYRRLESDEIYRKAFQDVERYAAQELEDTAYELAIGGDQQMLTLLLKRFRPEHYRERISTDTTISVNLVERMTAANERLLTLRRGEQPELSQPDAGDVSEENT